MLEIFNGFFNLEAKFWNTFVPLLTKPGKVSRDYIDGKRQRYTNPFRFYLTVSIVFFLLVGIYKTIEKYNTLAEETKKDVKADLKKDSKSKKELSQKEIDSITNQVKAGLNKSFIPLPEKTKKNIADQVEMELKDTTKVKDLDGKNINVNFGGDTKFDKYYDFLKKNPDVHIDDALDSLGYQKNFSNRFLYTRAKTLYSFKDKENRDQFFSQILSYGSIALFLLLPIFTLFLKFFYIRRKFTYVDHLVFVFHVQTVFFLLFSIEFIILICGWDSQNWVFVLMFLVYLYLAMKRFYKQGYIKTFFKFLLVNISYFFIAMFGVGLLFIISFALF